MYRFNVPTFNQHTSIWIELSTFEELPEQHRRATRPTMAQSMAKNPLHEVEISYGVVTRAIPYKDLLTAFPDIDPEKTYVTTHVETDRPYKWPPL